MTPQELKQIWDSLDDDEKRAMHRYDARRGGNIAIWLRLLPKGLVKNDGTTDYLTPLGKQVVRGSYVNN